MSGRQTITNFVLPLIIFPALLGLGVKFMYAEHLAAGVSASIDALCPSPSSSQIPKSLPFIFTSSKTYVRSYTFISSVDQGVCHLIAFFHLLLDSPFLGPRKFTSYLFGTALPYVIVPIIEAYRYPGKQHWLLRYPTFWLMLSQIVTLGIAFNLYWPLLLISRAPSSETEENSRQTNSGAKNSKKTDPGAEKIATLIGPAQAEGLIFGLTLGLVVPSVATVLQNDPFMTWVWQFFPVFVALARVVYVSLRPDSENRTKETVKPLRQNAIRAFYIACFLTASITHIYFVRPLLQRSDWKMQLVDFLIPLRPSPGAHPSRHAHNFLKWDHALGYGSILVGLLWSAGNFGQVVKILLWYAVAIPAFGAGGAVMGVLAWRDL